MEIKNISIGKIQNENEHLIVIGENGKYESVSLFLPVTAYALAERLEELARRLKKL